MKLAKSILLIAIDLLTAFFGFAVSELVCGLISSQALVFTLNERIILSAVITASGGVFINFSTDPDRNLLIDAAGIFFAAAAGCAVGSLLFGFSLFNYPVAYGVVLVWMELVGCFSKYMLRGSPSYEYDDYDDDYDEDEYDEPNGIENNKNLPGEAVAAIKAEESPYPMIDPFSNISSTQSQDENSSFVLPADEKAILKEAIKTATPEEDLPPKGFYENEESVLTKENATDDSEANGFDYGSGQVGDTDIDIDAFDFFSMEDIGKQALQALEPESPVNADATKEKENNEIKPAGEPLEPQDKSELTYSEIIQTIEDIHSAEQDHDEPLQTSVTLPPEEYEAETEPLFKEPEIYFELSASDEAAAYPQLKTDFGDKTQKNAPDPSAPPGEKAKPRAEGAAAQSTAEGEHAESMAEFKTDIYTDLTEQKTGQAPQKNDTNDEQREEMTQQDSLLLERLLQQLDERDRQIRELERNLNERKPDAYSYEGPAPRGRSSLEASFLERNKKEILDSILSDVKNMYSNLSSREKLIEDREYSVLLKMVEMDSKEKTRSQRYSPYSKLNELEMAPSDDPRMGSDIKRRIDEYRAETLRALKGTTEREANYSSRDVNRADYRYDEARVDPYAKADRYDERYDERYDKRYDERYPYTGRERYYPDDRRTAEDSYEPSPRYASREEAREYPKAQSERYVRERTYRDDSPEVYRKGDERRSEYEEGYRRENEEAPRRIREEEALRERYSYGDEEKREYPSKYRQSPDSVRDYPDYPNAIRGAETAAEAGKQSLAPRYEEKTEKPYVKKENTLSAAVSVATDERYTYPPEPENMPPMQNIPVAEEPGVKEDVVIPEPPVAVPAAQRSELLAEAKPEQVAAPKAHEPKSAPMAQIIETTITLAGPLSEEENGKSPVTEPDEIKESPELTKADKKAAPVAAEELPIKNAKDEKEAEEKPQIKEQELPVTVIAIEPEKLPESKAEKAGPKPQKQSVELPENAEKKQEALPEGLEKEKQTQSEKPEVIEEKKSEEPQKTAEAPEKEEIKEEPFVSVPTEVEPKPEKPVEEDQLEEEQSDLADLDFEELEIKDFIIAPYKNGESSADAANDKSPLSISAMSAPKIRPQDEMHIHFKPMPQAVKPVENKPTAFAQAKAKAEAEERARIAAAQAKAKAEAEERARIAAAQAKAKAEAEERARIAAAQAKAKAEAEERARIAAAQAKAKAEAEERARIAAAQAKAKAEAEERARIAAEQAKAKAEAEERARIAAAQAKAKAEAEEKARIAAAQAKAKAEAEERARIAAEQARAKAEAEERARIAAEQAKAKAEAEERARIAAEQAKAKAEAEERARIAAEQARAKAEAEEKARIAAEQARAKAEAEEKARIAAEQAKAKAEAEERARIAAEQARAKAEAEERARIAAEQAKAKAEAEEKARIAAEQARANAEAEERARAEEIDTDFADPFALDLNENDFFDKTLSFSNDDENKALEIELDDLPPVLKREAEVLSGNTPPALNRNTVNFKDAESDKIGLSAVDLSEISDLLDNMD